MFMAKKEGCKCRIFREAKREIKDATTSIGCKSLKILKILWMFRENSIVSTKDSEWL